MGVLVEVVCCSPADCRAAEAAGAGRIELCGAILAGGLTPSLGLFAACRKACTLPIMVMLRPREGGFLYSEEEFAQMESDAAEFAARGVNGVVFGILQADGSLDCDRMARLRAQVPSLEAMCHRAFDVVPDPFAALDELAEAGFTRVLSSGQTRDIREGMPLLRRLMEQAEGRIELQPCEHIRADNVGEVVRELRPKSVHLGPFRDVTDPTSDLGRPVTYGSHRELDAAEVKAVCDLVRELTPQPEP